MSVRVRLGEMRVGNKSFIKSESKYVSLVSVLIEFC
jgi:hypothetical protein